MFVRYFSAFARVYQSKFEWGSPCMFDKCSPALAFRGLIGTYCHGPSYYIFSLGQPLSIHLENSPHHYSKPPNPKPVVVWVTKVLINPSPPRFVGYFRPSPILRASVRQDPLTVSQLSPTATGTLHSAANPQLHMPNSVRRVVLSRQPILNGQKCLNNYTAVI